MSTNHSFFCPKSKAGIPVHKRDLPWRQNNDPYRIWLSEIILQQTRVAYGESYFKRLYYQSFQQFMNLANAPEDHVLKIVARVRVLQPCYVICTKQPS